MKLYRYIFLFFMFYSCNPKEYIDVAIETRTDLTSLEITNYYPSSSNSLSKGYITESLSKMNNDTYSTIVENHANINHKSIGLYFDSLDYDMIKNVDSNSYFGQNIISTYLNRNIVLDSTVAGSTPTIIGLRILDKGSMMVTLEVPINHTLNWSIVKIWCYDELFGRPQLHSVLLAEDNSFDSLNVLDNNILLGDGDFIYRVVLSEDFRFGRNMDIFVSMDFDEFR